MIKSRRGCLWAVWLVLVVGLCAFAGLGRLADGAGVVHAAGYQLPWYPGGLIGCLCLVVPTAGAGVALGFLRGRRTPKVDVDRLLDKLDGDLARDAAS